MLRLRPPVQLLLLRVALAVLVWLPPHSSVRAAPAVLLHAPHPGAAPQQVHQHPQQQPGPPPPGYGQGYVQQQQGQMQGYGYGFY